MLCALALAGCSDQLEDNELAGLEMPATQVENEYQYYLKRARWGDADAYVKLADCYRNGVGVDADFVGMVGMLTMAEKYGSFMKVEDYFNALPDDDCNKKLFFAMDGLEKKGMDKAALLSDTLKARGVPEGHILAGVIQIEQGDTIGGLETIRRGADLGSSFGKLIIGMAPSVFDVNKPYDADILVKMAERHPYANKFLANIYAGEGCDGMQDEELAAMHYLKADEHGFLGIKGARWLLGYYAKKGIQIDEREKQRLTILAGGCSEELDADDEEGTSPAGASYDEFLDSLARAHMERGNCDKAVIYVVETGTGRMAGRCSLERDGDQFTPFTDTFNRENDYIHGVATFLAVLWTGLLMPETMIDTGCGVHEDANGRFIRDHDWLSGGHSEMSLEKVLTHRSEAGFAKAIEMAYKNDRKIYEEQVSFYLAEQPDNLMGMLTFFNAIANQGRMIKICDAEDPGNTVIHDQICYPEYIWQVQRAMEHCVTDGLYREAGSDYADVAACGRSLRTSDTHYRLELCGYFPTKNPKFTVIVVMEKDGMPASAGGMCGPLFSQIAAGLSPHAE